jgi:protein ImuB
MMYAVLHPPNFFAQAAAHGRPELNKRPFVVLDGQPPTETVFAVSRAARSLGTDIGITRLQAESLPGITVLRREAEREGAVHTALHDVACRFSPRIERVEERPGTYALDVQGMSGLFGEPPELARKLCQAIETTGLFANVAVAENFHAAVCLACGRRGISVVPSGCERDALSQLPLWVLDVAPEHAATFASWGLRTCGELAALSEIDLISRIGKEGRRLHALARGEWPHLLFPIEPSFDSGLVERMELDFPVENLEQLLFLLSRMTTALLERTRSKARAIGCLRVVLDLEEKKRHERTVRPALPLEDTATLLKLLQLDLETHPASAAVVAVELHAQSAPPYRAQHGLFLPQAPEPGLTEVMLARLRKLLGEGRVGSPELTDDHRPNAFRMAPFAPPSPRREEQPQRSVPIALRVCRPPQAIGVQFASNAPARVFWDSTVYVVREAAGPVRVNGQWWSEANWCREEWDVRLVSQNVERVCRIAFDPGSRYWYLQGTYD